ncbi:hypothetical protein JOC48_001098 [Aquibacillus albus]|uniref:Uncharacterized protein n=1 Tax=Aquibacillus albus TaxID=1168171 RepID=A0ABS2MXK8_9BACI|nr:hypothetical protein [Aquibacillus albus]
MSKSSKLAESFQRAGSGGSRYVKLTEWTYERSPERVKYGDTDSPVTGKRGRFSIKPSMSGGTAVNRLIVPYECREMQS